MPAPTLTQSKSGRQTVTTNGSITFNSTATKGNLLVINIGMVSLATATAVTGGWTKDYGGSSSQRLHAYSKVADGTETAFSWTAGASGTLATFFYEFALTQMTNGVMDVMQVGSGTSVTSMSTGTTATVTNQDTALTAMVSCGGSVVAGSPTWSNSFTAATAQTECVGAYRLVSAAVTTYTTTWGTWTTNRTGNSMILAYRWTADTLSPPFHSLSQSSMRALLRR